MPLQSGNNKQLKAMKRRYKRELYASRVSRILASIPSACIGVDVIVGFPGETDEDFLETYNFLNGLEISYLHVFTFSERENTVAFHMEDQVPMNKRRKRNEMLTALSLNKKTKFYQKGIGETRKVLLEKDKSNDYLSGFTDNYLKIRIPVTSDIQANQIKDLKLLNLNEEDLTFLATHSA